IRERPGKFVSVSPGLSVRRDAAGKVQCRGKLSSEVYPAGMKLNFLGRGGKGKFGGGKISLKKKEAAGRESNSEFGIRNLEFFDADKIGGEIVLRHWRPGDRLQPIGFKSAVKLQDLFVNAKIPAARRRELVLAVTAAGEIFWVEGLRIG